MVDQLQSGAVWKTEAAEEGLQGAVHDLQSRKMMAADMFMSSRSLDVSSRKSFSELFDMAAPRGMAVRHSTMSRTPSQMRMHLTDNSSFVSRSSFMSRSSFVSRNFASHRPDSPMAIPDIPEDEPCVQSIPEQAPEEGAAPEPGMVNSLRNFFTRKSYTASQANLSVAGGSGGGARFASRRSWRPSASLRSFANSIANFFGSKQRVTEVDQQEQSLAYFKKEVSMVLGDDHPEIKVFAGRDETWLLNQGKAPVGILHPYSIAKVHWDMLCMVLLFYSVIALPVKLSFDFEAINGCSTDFNRQPWHFYADLVVDSVFLLDILVVFRTAYFHPETRLLVVEPAEIARRYLKSYFVLDLLSALPVDLILLPYCERYVSGANSVLKTPRVVRQLRMLRMFRLLRLSKVKFYLDTIQDRLHIHPGVLRLMKFTLIVFLVAHMNACIFFLLGESFKGEDGSETTWTTSELMPNYLGELVLVTSMSIGEQYCISLYWSTTTLTTLGFGDITPVTTPEIIFCTLVILEGGAALGWVVGSMADLLSRLNLRKKRHYERMQYWEDVFYRGAFPPVLRRKIRSYLEYMLANGISKLPDFAQRELSKGNLRSLMSFIYREHLRKVPWFRSLSDDVLTDLALALDHMSVPPGEIIYREGETGDSMYFLQKGKMQLSMLMLPPEQQASLGPRRIRQLINQSLQGFYRDGIIPKEAWGEGSPCAMFKWSANDQGSSIFGASCLFSGSVQRLSSAKALTGCTLLTLSSEAMREITRKHPALRRMGVKVQMKQHLRMYRTIKSVISQRREKRQAAAKLVVTLHAGINMPKMDALTGSCDAYCVLNLFAAARNIGKAQTTIMYNTYTPEWRETFTFHLTDYNPQDALSLKFSVMDWDAVGSHDKVGDAEIDLSETVHTAVVNSMEAARDPQWVQVTMPDGKGGVKKVKGRRGKLTKVQVSFRLIPASGPLIQHSDSDRYSMFPPSPDNKAVMGHADKAADKERLKGAVSPEERGRIGVFGSQHGSRGDGGWTAGGGLEAVAGGEGSDLKVLRERVIKVLAELEGEGAAGHVDQRLAEGWRTVVGLMDLLQSGITTLKTDNDLVNTSIRDLEATIHSCPSALPAPPQLRSPDGKVVVVQSTSSVFEAERIGGGQQQDVQEEGAGGERKEGGSKAGEGGEGKEEGNALQLLDVEGSTRGEPCMVEMQLERVLKECQGWGAVRWCVGSESKVEVRSVMGRGERVERGPGQGECSLWLSSSDGLLLCRVPLRNAASISVQEDGLLIRDGAGALLLACLLDTEFPAAPNSTHTSGEVGEERYAAVKTVRDKYGGCYPLEQSPLTPA